MRDSFRISLAKTYYVEVQIGIICRRYAFLGGANRRYNSCDNPGSLVCPGKFVLTVLGALHMAMCNAEPVIVFCRE
jgi:hypothetical protein